MDCVHGRCEQQGVAVGCCLGYQISAEDPIVASDIVDIDLLAEALAEFWRDDAGHQIDRSTRGKRHDDADCPIGISRTAGGAPRSKHDQQQAEPD